MVNGQGLMAFFAYFLGYNGVMGEINPKIFKAYDIRGIYPEEINEDVAYRFALAWVAYLEKNSQLAKRKLIIGRDVRLSSGELFESLTAALQSRGIDILDLGQVSTSLFYWAMVHQDVDGGAMITASHNPAQYNGFKVCARDGRALGGESGLFEIRDLAQKIESVPIVQAAGKVSRADLCVQYLADIKSKFDFKKISLLKLVFDCGNGMVGPEIKELFRDLPCQTEILFGEPDGNFPNHEPNPIKEETLAVLRQKVLDSGANLGAAFDGDGDRAVFMDEKGEAIRGDFVLALLAEELLRDTPQQKILYEVRSSRVVSETIRRSGGAAVLGRAGHSLMKDQMRREDIALGGELSGHYFYRSLGFVEDALFTTLKMLEILSIKKQPLSGLIAPFKKYFNSGEINFEIADPAAKLQEAEGYFKGQGAEIKKIDGLTVEYPDWWFNLRKSNTEPLVRLNLEADSAELLEEKKRELLELLK